MILYKYLDSFDSRVFRSILSAFLTQSLWPLIFLAVVCSSINASVCLSICLSQVSSLMTMILKHTFRNKYRLWLLKKMCIDSTNNAAIVATLCNFSMKNMSWGHYLAFFLFCIISGRHNLCAWQWIRFNCWTIKPRQLAFSSINKVLLMSQLTEGTVYGCRFAACSHRLGNYMWWP